MKIVLLAKYSQEETADSSDGNWYNSSVQKLSEKKGQTYAPEKNITRGEMAEIIYGILK